MFDNPEKLLILVVVALLIFGPSKLAGFGGSLGRTLRDFRNAVRDAQDEARQTFSELTQEASTAMHEFHQEASTAVADFQQALPAPDLMEAAAGGESAAEPVAPPVPESASTGAQAETEDPSSLASEPTAAALREVTRRAEHADL